MRHPAAPTVIAILLGFLAFMVLWSRARSDGHHEGNPHPDNVPWKNEKHDAGDHNATDDDNDSDDSTTSGRD